MIINANNMNWIKTFNNVVCFFSIDSSGLYDASKCIYLRTHMNTSVLHWILAMFIGKEIILRIFPFLRFAGQRSNRHSCELVTNFFFYNSIFAITQVR